MAEERHFPKIPLSLVDEIERLQEKYSDQFCLVHVALDYVKLIDAAEVERVKKQRAGLSINP